MTNFRNNISISLDDFMVSNSGQIINIAKQIYLSFTSINRCMPHSFVYFDRFVLTNFDVFEISIKGIANT